MNAVTPIGARLLRLFDHMGFIDWGLGADEPVAQYKRIARHIEARGQRPISPGRLRTLCELGEYKPMTYYEVQAIADAFNISTEAIIYDVPPHRGKINKGLMRNLMDEL